MGYLYVLYSLPKYPTFRIGLVKDDIYTNQISYLYRGAFEIQGLYPTWGNEQRPHRRPTSSHSMCIAHDF